MSEWRISKQTFSVKYLSFYLDCNLSWNLHCDSVAAKVERGLGLIRTLRNEIPSRILIILCHSLIIPFLSYVCLLGTSSFVSNFKIVQILQNKVVRVLGDYVRFENSASSCLTKIKILSV